MTNRDWLRLGAWIFATMPSLTILAIALHSNVPTSGYAILFAIFFSGFVCGELRESRKVWQLLDRVRQVLDLLEEAIAQRDATCNELGRVQTRLRRVLGYTKGGCNPEATPPLRTR